MIWHCIFSSPSINLACITSSEHIFISQIICANKTDLEDRRKVTRQDEEAVAKALDVKLIETSAKTGHNVQEAFIALVRKIPRKGVSYKVIKEQAKV